MCTAVIACGDSTGVEPDDIAGTWTATSLTATNPENSSEFFDLIAMGGSLTITFRTDGTYTATEVIGGVTETDSGTYTVSGTTLTVVSPGASPLAINAVRDGDMMTLRWTEEDDEDWDDNGTDDPSDFEIVLTR